MDNPALKIEELKVGKMYKCLLSGKTVMICQNYVETRTMSGSARMPTDGVYLKYFNTIAESFATSEIVDYQLTEL